MSDAMQVTKEITRPTRNVHVWACGGTATEIISAMDLGIINTKDSGYANTRFLYADTSASVASGRIDGRDYFQIADDQDGSGGVRSANIQKVLARVPSIVDKSGNPDYAIVVHSSFGGSGSVIGPAIAKTYRERDIPVISIALTSDRTLKAIENSDKTLQTYDALASAINKPLFTLLLDASGHDGLKRVQTNVHIAVRRLLQLFSNRFDRLDTADVTNFLSPEKLGRPVPNCLYAVDIFSDAEGVNRCANEFNITTFVSLYAERNLEEVYPRAIAGYQGYGMIVGENVNQLHFVTTPEMVTALSKKLAEQHKSYDEVVRSVGVRDTIVTSNVSSDGFVL